MEKSLIRTHSWLLVVAAAMLMTMAMLCTEAECRAPSLHRVGGGKYTWKPNVSFTDWAAHQQFYAGDWLYFGFDKHKYDVLQVNETSYEKCINTDFIQNVTRGGRDVFNLTEMKSYYFICGRGDYCLTSGMRVAVHVEPAPAPAPAFIKTASSPPAAAASRSSTYYGHYPLLVCAAVVSSTFYFGCI